MTSLRSELARISQLWAESKNNETLASCGETLLELLREEVRPAFHPRSDEHLARGRALIEQGWETIYGPGWEDFVSFEVVDRSYNSCACVTNPECVLHGDHMTDKGGNVE